jgi:AcrR family transcriptional regulator
MAQVTAEDRTATAEDAAGARTGAAMEPTKKFVGRSAEDAAQRRRLIIQVGRRLAVKGGPDAVQMRAVAAEVGITLVTLYRLVPSKNALLLLVAQDSVDRLWRRCERDPIVGGTRSQRAAHALRLAFENVAKTPKLGNAMALVIFGGSPGEEQAPAPLPDIHHSLTDIVRRAIESDGLPIDAAEEDLIFLCRLVWGGALSMWLSGMIDREKALEMLDLACERINLD